MRNEIFSRINQNKIQYYAELKNRQSTMKIEKTHSTEEVKVRRINRINKSGIALAKSSKFIQQQLSVLITLVLFHLRKFNKYLTQKASIQSNRMTEGLSRISSQLFEDQFEYHENSEMDNKTNNQSLIVGLGLSSGATLSMPYEFPHSNIENQLMVFLNKLYRNIILFLDSDNWFEEINQSQRCTQDQVSGTQDNTKSSVNSEFEVPSYSTVFGNIKSRTGYIDNILNIGHIGIYFKKVRTYLNSVAASLFPTLNRFI